MIRLNHSTIVENKQVTPFLIQGTNVYCFDKKKETIILPIDSFKTKRKNKKPIVVPIARTNNTRSSSRIYPVKPTMIVKAVGSGIIKVMGSADFSHVANEIVVQEVGKYRYKASGMIKTIGAADVRKEVVEETIIPPVVDNSRYVRPSLDNDYI